MAKQRGIIKYSGTLDDMVGYEMDGVSFVKKAAKKYKLSPESIKSGKDFGTGSEAAALVRKAFEPVLPHAFRKDRKNRVAGRVRKVIWSGPEHKKGKRQVFDGDVTLLKGFEFNEHTELGRLTQIVSEIEVLDGVIKLVIPPFDATKCIFWESNFSTAVIGITCGFFNFDEEYATIKFKELRLQKKVYKGLRLRIRIPDKEELAVLVLMTICFESTTSQGRIERSGNRKYQAAQLVGAFHLRKGVVQVFVPEEKVIPKAKEPEPIEEMEWEEY